MERSPVKIGLCFLLIVLYVTTIIAFTSNKANKNNKQPYTMKKGC